MNYKIVPLNVGVFEALPKQVCMYRMYREVTLTLHKIDITKFAGMLKLVAFIR